MLKERSGSMSAEDRRKSLLAEVNAFSQTVGKVEVWRIANFDMVALDPDAYGQFYSGDSYIILHSYTDDRGRDAWVIYFWLGRHSSTDEIGTAALKATELDDKYGGAPVQVRVTQNKEPLHMLRLFTGKFIGAFPALPAFVFACLFVGQFVCPSRMSFIWFSARGRKPFVIQKRHGGRDHIGRDWPVPHSGLKRIQYARRPGGQDGERSQFV